MTIGTDQYLQNYDKNTKTTLNTNNYQSKNYGIINRIDKRINNVIIKIR